MSNKITSQENYSFQIKYRDTCIKFYDYTDALRWCRDASKEGVKNAVIERIIPSKKVHLVN